MLTMIGESMNGAAASKLDSNENTFPSSVFGTTLVIMERITIAGVEEKMQIPAPKIERILFLLSWITSSMF